MVLVLPFVLKHEGEATKTGVLDTEFHICTMSSGLCQYFKNYCFLYFVTELLILFFGELRIYADSAMAPLGSV
jgi:hypothetical protein